MGLVAPSSPLPTEEVSCLKSDMLDRYMMKPTRTEGPRFVEDMIPDVRSQSPDYPRFGLGGKRYRVQLWHGICGTFEAVSVG